MRRQLSHIYFVRNARSTYRHSTWRRERTGRTLQTTSSDTVMRPKACWSATCLASMAGDKGEVEVEVEFEDEFEVEGDEGVILS